MSLTAYRLLIALLICGYPVILLQSKEETLRPETPAASPKPVARQSLTSIPRTIPLPGPRGQTRSDRSTTQAPQISPDLLTEQDLDLLEAELAAEEAIETTQHSFLTQLPLEPAQIKSLKLGLYDIAEAEFRARAALDSLAAARSDVDLELQETLPTETYRRFKQDQLEEPSRVVLSQISSFATESERQLSSASKEKLAALLASIESSAALAEVSGIYGGTPTVSLRQLKAGTPEFSRFQIDRESRLEGEQSWLLDQITDPTTREVVDEFYRSQISLLQP